MACYKEATDMGYCTTAALGKICSGLGKYAAFVQAEFTKMMACAWTRAGHQL